MTTENALILIDFINDIVHQDGKLAKKGYHDFTVRHKTPNALQATLEHARAKGWLVCHVRVGFLPTYVDHPSHSPLFGAAKQYRALCQNEWGTEFNEIALPSEKEPIVQKSRVSAFYNTNLDTILRINGTRNVYIAGVATDLAVEAAVRDAHDRDYLAYVISDCCAAASDEDHQKALTTLSKVAKVVNSKNLT